MRQREKEGWRGERKGLCPFLVVVPSHRSEPHTKTFQKALRDPLLRQDMARMKDIKRKEGEQSGLVRPHLDLVFSYQKKPLLFLFLLILDMNPVIAPIACGVDGRRGGKRREGREHEEKGGEGAEETTRPSTLFFSSPVVLCSSLTHRLLVRPLVVWLLLTRPLCSFINGLVCIPFPCSFLPIPAFIHSSIVFPHSTLFDNRSSLPLLLYLTVSTTNHDQKDQPVPAGAREPVWRERHARGGDQGQCQQVR